MRNNSEIIGKNSEMLGNISEINYTLYRVIDRYIIYTYLYTFNRYSISKR